MLDERFTCEMAGSFDVDYRSLPCSIRECLQSPDSGKLKPPVQEMSGLATIH